MTVGRHDAIKETTAKLRPYSFTHDKKAIATNMNRKCDRHKKQNQRRGNRSTTGEKNYSIGKPILSPQNRKLIFSETCCIKNDEEIKRAKNDVNLQAASVCFPITFS